MFMTLNNEQTYMYFSTFNSINMITIDGHSFFVQQDRISYTTVDEMKATIRDIHSAQSSFLFKFTKVMDKLGQRVRFQTTRPGASAPTVR